MADEVFDPEKAVRLQIADAYTMCTNNDPAFPFYVDSEDYNKLLALYRAKCAEVKELGTDIDRLEQMLEHS